MNRRALLRTIAATGSAGLLGSIAGCAGGGGSGGSGGGSGTSTTTSGSMTENATTTGGGSMTSSTTTTGNESMNAGVTVTVSSNEEYGDILVDSDGFSLYRFEPDGKGNSTCQGECASVWPPLVTESPMKGNAVRATIGTITRKNGSKQVTADSYPLYRYEPDEQSGDTKGQDVESFGGEWYLVAPDGSLVEKERKSGEGGGGSGTNTTTGSGY